MSLRSLTWIVQLSNPSMSPVSSALPAPSFRLIGFCRSSVSRCAMSRSARSPLALFLLTTWVILSGLDFAVG